MVWKPSEKEEEYFARMEFERKKKLEEEKHKTLEEEEKERVKQLHYMRCPKCGMELIEIDYKDIKVDKPCCCIKFGAQIHQTFAIKGRPLNQRHLLD